MPSDGKMIEIARPDGATLPAYLATPESGDRAPAVVLIQEWWGLNQQMKATADRLAQAGYRALVPDLYRGKVAVDGDEANHLMTDLDWLRLPLCRERNRCCLPRLPRATRSRAAVPAAPLAPPLSPFPQ